MQPDTHPEHHSSPLRERVWRIIFLSDTRAGKAFDVVLLCLITCSVVVVMLESVRSFQKEYAIWFDVLEWAFTLLFTVEYGVRLWSVRRKWKYALSFFGLVDLLSILPTYLALFLEGSEYFMVIRIFRLLRMFRVLKMVRHVGEANVLLNALKASRPKILVFLFGVMTIVCIIGTLMYLIESTAPDSQFDSIPQAVYWSIVTITTVGFGDITPITVPGKILASMMMLIGYAIIAVPTGIAIAELNREMSAVQMDRRQCPECGLVGHDTKARFCRHCGSQL